jgi:predicted dehydrogenase
LSEGVDRWLVVGSRRWARIVAAELCARLPPGRSIHLQASRGDAGLLAWWNASPHQQRIEIVDEPVPCGASTTGVALVVNSAHEHRGSVETVLDAGYHVVCEKPLTFSRQDTLQLLARARERGLQLFGTNTYLFADYLYAFRRDWLRGRPFSELELTWADSGAEIRHGEAKSYDSSVPVIFDVLPHVASIVLATHGPFDVDHSSIAVAQGGSAATALFAGRDLTLRASMARNAARRTRLLRLRGPDGQVTLDFATEPGLVSLDQGDSVSADPAWPTKRKPIAQMLESVSAYFAGGVLDARLGADAALLGNDLSDGVAESYAQQQIDFLMATARGPRGSRGEDCAYAAKEVKAIRQRGLPLLPQASPLRRLAMLSVAGASAQPEFTQPGKALS